MTSPSEQLPSDALVMRCAAQIQECGDNVVNRLSDFVQAGGDPHSVVQALELFVRAVVADEARAMLEKHRNG